MRQLIAHFKERPKTAALLLVIAFVISGAALWTAREDAYEPVSWQRGLYAVTSMGEQESSDGYGMMGGSPGKQIQPTMPGVPMVFEERMMPPYYGGDSAGPTAADVDQKIIKTGNMDLLVDDVADAAAKVGGIAVDRGGFVQSSSVSEGGNGAYYGNVIIRVPVEAFEEVMAELRGLATLVRNESSNGQDVTEQYTDLEAQLRNAKAQEETYLEVLKQARSVEDILKVQERLGMIRSQIESLQGRIQYLTNSTSYSTISVSLSEEPAVRAPTKEFRPFAIIKEAFQTLVVVAQDVIAGIIWVVIVWGGILLPIGLIGWFIARAWKKRRQM